MIELLVNVFSYISEAPFFWGAMGFTTALGMFVGALIYDGELTEASKGIVSVISYACMIVWMNLTRIANVLGPNLDVGHTRTGMAFAGTATVVAVTLAWLLGMFLGVVVFKFKYRGKPHD